MADDLGWSDIGCYGGEIPTPSLDQLANEGLRFTQFYNNAVCGPTRASLLTGLYCQQVGHSGAHWNQPKDFSKCVTISEVLQRAGYHTAMVGKWQGRDLAVNRGFDHFFGPNCQGKISYFDAVVDNDFFLDDQPWNDRGDDFYMTHAFSDFAVEFLDEHLGSEAGKDQPMFLYLAYVAPHWPLHAKPAEIAPHRERYRSRGWNAWRDERLEKQRSLGLIPADWGMLPFPAGIKPWSDDPWHDWQAERMAVYSAQVAAIDRGVGQVLETLKLHDAERDTLVIFLSDNGAAPDGGLVPHPSGLGFSPADPKPNWRRDGVAISPGSGPDHMPGSANTFAAYGLAWATVSNTPFRSTKLTAYEGGIRTPLIARWPSVITKQGAITSQVGHVIDLMPTLLELAGADYPIPFDDRLPLPMEGVSLRPVFTSQGKPLPMERTLAWSAPRNQAIRQGNWKLVNEKRGLPWQLFDLEADGTESTDLASEHPERVATMAKAFADWQKHVGEE